MSSTVDNENKIRPAFCSKCGEEYEFCGCGIKRKKNAIEKEELSEKNFISYEL